MDQVKIGRFISERRKNAGLTQIQLAEMLGITDRAVSKWETGRALPDSSIMLELCGILKITVNDLLCGEVIKMDNYNKETEKQLLDMVKEKEESDRRLLKLEVAMGIATIIPFLAVCAFVSFYPLKEWAAALAVLASLVPFLIVAPFMMRIEQKAGYYECKACGHRYVPRFFSVFFAMHTGRTRFMRCPSCGKRTWQKKVVEKDTNK